MAIVFLCVYILYTTLCPEAAAGTQFSNCFASCRCAANSSVVLCASGNLRALPLFPPQLARKIQVLGLQRNGIAGLDTAAVVRQLPALRLLDLRDQVGRACVYLSSPFPQRIKVKGVTCVAPLQETTSTRPPIYPPVFPDDDLDPDLETTTADLPTTSDDSGADNTTAVNTPKMSSPAPSIPLWQFDQTLMEHTLRRLLQAVTSNVYVQVCYF